MKSELWHQSRGGDSKCPGFQDRGTLISGHYPFGDVLISFEGHWCTVHDCSERITEDIKA